MLEMNSEFVAEVLGSNEFSEGSVFDQIQKESPKIIKTGSVGPAKNKDVATLLFNVRILINGGEFALATNLLREICNRDSYNTEAIGLLVGALTQMKSFAEAKAVAKAHIGFERTSKSLFQFAGVANASNALDEALEAYFEGLALFDGEAVELFEVYKNIGNIYLKQGDSEGAEEFYNKAYSLQPTSDVLLVNLGTLYFQRSDWNRAADSFKSAIVQNPKNDQAHVGLAIAYNEVSDFELAWANIQRAFDINPENRTAVHFLANWSQRDRQHSKGIAALQIYLGAVEWDSDMSLALIHLLCASSQYQVALVECERFLCWEPEQQEVKSLRRRLKGILSGH